LVHQGVVLAVVGGGVDDVQRGVVHVVVAVALDGDQEREAGLVLRHGFVQGLEVAVGGRVGLVGAAAVGFLGGEGVLKIGLVEAQGAPGRIPPVVGVGVGVGRPGGVAQSLGTTAQ